MLKAYVITPVPAVRTAIVALLRRILSAGVLFQHDADEIALWLDALPLTRRTVGAQAPDGAPLTDEADGVITFLDDCVQRCVKTPYKYVEELQATYSATRPASDGEGQPGASSIGERPEAFPSPLLATVFEQLGAKLKGKILSPSDALALFAFVRKLVLRISSKSADLDLARAFAQKLAAFAEGQELFSAYPTMESALRREVRLLNDQLAQLQDPQEPMDQGTTPAVQEFLAQIEKLDDRESFPGMSTQNSRLTRAAAVSDVAGQTSAYELVDWLRLIGPRLHSSELVRLVKATERFHAPAAKELLQYLNPREVSLWAGTNLIFDSPPPAHMYVSLLIVSDACLTISQSLGSDQLFLHCTHESVRDQACRAVLVECLFAASPDAIALKRAIRMVLHRLSHTVDTGAVTGDYLHLLAEIVERLKASAPGNSVSSVVLFCFETDVFKSLCSQRLNDTVREGMLHGGMLRQSLT